MRIRMSSEYHLSAFLGLKNPLLNFANFLSSQVKLRKHTGDFCGRYRQTFVFLHILASRRRAVFVAVKANHAVAQAHLIG